MMCYIINKKLNNVNVIIRHVDMTKLIWIGNTKPTNFL